MRGVCACLAGVVAAAVAAPSVKDALSKRADLVDAASVVKELQVELKYATADNFLGRAVYGDLDACYLQRDAADMLARAQQVLVGTHPELRLHVYDCARPLWVQREMWDVVKGTPKQPYVANPAHGSIHNFGCAVDVTAATLDGKSVDMGTPFDYFGDLARVDAERENRAAGKLSAAAVDNRVILRRAMQAGGFSPIANEWWHFDCAGNARKRYKVIP